MRKSSPQHASRKPATEIRGSRPLARQDGLLRIGYVAGAHGLDSALRIRPDNPDADAFAQVSHVYLEMNDAVTRYEIITTRRASKTSLKVVLEGVADVDAAEKLRGAQVLVATADLPPVQAGEFYYYQVIGCDVLTTDGLRIGTIEEVFSNGANEVWVVRAGKAEVLVPVIADVVKIIDLEAHKITIEAVPGLLD